MYTYIEENMEDEEKKAKCYDKGRTKEKKCDGRELEKRTTKGEREEKREGESERREQERERKKRSKQR